MNERGGFWMDSGWILDGFWMDSKLVRKET